MELMVKLIQLVLLGLMEPKKELVKQEGPWLEVRPIMLAKQMLMEEQLELIMALKLKVRLKLMGRQQ